MPMVNQKVIIQLFGHSRFAISDVKITLCSGSVGLCLSLCEYFSVSKYVHVQWKCSLRLSRVSSSLGRHHCWCRHRCQWSLHSLCRLTHIKNTVTSLSTSSTYISQHLC